MDRFHEFLRRHPRLESAISAARPYLPPLNFITIHYAYFITVCLVTSVIFWGSSDPKYSISYTDSLFLVVSAMTEAGLNTVNLSEMTTWQQVLLWLLIIFGSSIWVSIWTVLARKHVFERRFTGIARRSRLWSPQTSNRQGTLTTDLPMIQKLVGNFGIGKSPTVAKDETTENGQQTDPSSNVRDPVTGSTPAFSVSGPFAVHESSETQIHDDHKKSTDALDATSPAESGRDHISFANTIEADQPKGSTTGFDQGAGVSRRYASTSDESRLELGPLPPKLDDLNFLTPKKVGRNGQFHDLSSEEREHLGSTEYRALKVLSIAVPLYFCAWQILGCVSLGAWVAKYNPQPALDNAVNPWWNGIFNGVSAFNNSGMSVLDANMIPYGSSYFVLVVMGIMILAGNTAYPIFLRFWIWSVLKLLNLLTYEESFHDLKVTLEYILRYPRRVYTNLFPARATWWLLFMLFVLNGTDWVAFEILNIGNPQLAHVPIGSRVIDGLFQALAVRSGGFYIVAIPTLYIGLQVLYVIMMYISVYPVVITMRHSNVYEERSLGIYADDMDTRSMSMSFSSPPGPPGYTASTSPPSNFVDRAFRNVFGDWEGVGAARAREKESPISFISYQVRGQLSHDLWWLVLAVLLITIIETRHFLEDPLSWSVFNVVLEVVSAYGCVGLSVGVPFDNFSFSGGWYPGSKLILCAVMIRGRHRGLPVALDRAVRFPEGEMGREEEEDHRIRRSISMRASMDHRDD